MQKVALPILGMMSVMFMLGCEGERRTTRFDPYGKTYYLDGAGNMGYGSDSVPRGLRMAGFKGDVQNIVWTSFTGPLGDQLIRVNAHVQAEELKKKIVRYRKRYPDAPVYLIGLSAGTGVAVWAVESLPSGVMVDGMMLLGSSLSCDCDMTKCLRHVTGKVEVLYSSRDAVLAGFIPVTGTIDGRYLVQPAGQVGMRPPPRASDETRALYSKKIINTPWRESFSNYGYAGGHTDATSYRFVKNYIGPRLLKSYEPPTTKPDKQVTTVSK